MTQFLWWNEAMDLAASVTDDDDDLHSSNLIVCLPRAVVISNGIWLELHHSCQ